MLKKARIILHDIKKNPPTFFTESSVPAYEALIHYNQGVAKQHMALHDKALNEYDQSIEKIHKVKNLIDKSWLTYVYHPAILQKAEVLIKMQFSYNALTVLKKINNDSSSIFHRRRRELLKLTCYIDLSDWNRFDKQWEKEIHCRDKDNKTSPIFQDDKGNPVFLSIPYSTVDKNGLVFLNAKKPQPSTQGIPFSLASQYNSLVLERAKEQLTQEVGKIKDEKNVTVNEEEIKKIKDFKIVTFIEGYINQCEDNRFDKLTLQETILDYVQIIGKLIDTKKKRFSKLSKDNCRNILNNLIGILKTSHFVV